MKANTKKVMIPAAVIAFFVLGGLAFYAYSRFGFGANIADGFVDMTNAIVNGVHSVFGF